MATPRRTGDLKKARAANALAHPPQGTSEAAALSAHFRQRLRTKRAKFAFDYAWNLEPRDTLRLVNAVLVAHLDDIVLGQRHLGAEIDALTKLPPIGENEAERQMYAARIDERMAYLHEIQRNGRHLKSISDGLRQAAKVVADFGLNDGPQEIAVKDPAGVLDEAFTKPGPPALH